MPHAPAPPAVELFWLDPTRVDEAALAGTAAWLTEEEKARHRAFVFEKNRREYLVTRALARLALSRVRRAPPQAWRFVRTSHGRPELDPPCGLRFNLSNHPTMVVCAVHESDRAIGTDVEPLDRGAEVLEIAPTVFSSRELEDLRALPADRRAERAISLWTLKEAYIKARGLGLSLPLQEFSFLFVTSRIEICFSQAMQEDPARWQFAMFDRLGHRLAVAVEISPGRETSQVRCADAPLEI